MTTSPAAAPGRMVPKRRRVLFLASSAPRFEGDPTSPFVLNMARDLKELGWQVEILAPHAPGLKRSEVLDGVTIRRFRYMWPGSLQVLCYGGGAAVNLKRGVFRKLLVFPFLVAELMSACMHLFRVRPSLIHSHWVIPQGVIGQLLTSGFIPHIISVHGTDVFGLQHPVLGATKAWALKRCTHVIANSSATKAAVEALCNPRSLSVIPTGTQPPAGNPANHLQRSLIAAPQVPIILFVGRLIEGKGVAYLLQAMQLLLKERRAKLVVVGDGPERLPLERSAKDLGITDDCTFVGSVPHRDVAGYLAIADVFVGPSVQIRGESTEAQGNTFVEALFARVPVVATGIGGIPDAILHERTGLLVAERSPREIAEAVERLLSDPVLADRLKTQGYDHALAHFSRQGSAVRIDAIYRTSLASLQS